MSTSSVTGQSTIYQRPAELLQNLIRFNTSNPPGNEAECIKYIGNLLTSAGIQTSILALNPARPNLVTRLPGRGDAPPLLLYGHVDVVTTENQTWQHPPFEGQLLDGYIWGRGALDNKGGVAIFLAALMRAKAENIGLSGDVILAVVSDEEQGGTYGSKYLVEKQADLLKGVRYALAEFGGFSYYMGKRKFYPIMVAEKPGCLLKAKVRGSSGHGSMPMHGGAAARLGQILQKLDTTNLPVHVTPITKSMIEIFAQNSPFPSSLFMRQILKPGLTDWIIKMLGSQGKTLDPLFHNTVNVTTVHGGEQLWGTPGEICVELAVSLLPGYTPDNAIAEIQQIIGKIDIECTVYDPIPAQPDMGLFPNLVDVLRETDPEGIPVPILFPTPTDGRIFSRLGIQTYGYMPMKLSPDFSFWIYPHAADERVPAEALDFGARAVFNVLQRFGQQNGPNLASV